MCDTDVSEIEPGDYPPSAAFVLYILKREGEMTQSDLSEEACLPARTTRWALNRLEEAGLVESRPSVMDARETLYGLTNNDSG